MKKIFTLLAFFCLSLTSFAQNLDNTVWKFPAAKVAQISGLIGGLDSAKVFFDAPDLFYVEFYNQGITSTSFDGSYSLNVPNNTALLVDSTNATNMCGPIEEVSCDYAVLDTVLTLSNVQSTCSTWELIIPGDYYLDAPMTTNALDENTAVEFVLFPNPAKSSVHFNRTISCIDLFDLNGNIVRSASNASSLSLDNLPKGFYHVKATEGNRSTYQKLIIE